MYSRDQRKQILSYYGYDNNSKINSTMKRLGIQHREQFVEYLMSPMISEDNKRYTPVYTPKSYTTYVTQ